jgi:NADH-ubiquinone oxidoreductase chain 5
LKKGSSQKKREMKVHQNMNVGSVIHAMSNKQDMRKMGGFTSLLSFSYVMMFIGIISLIGFPFCTGFYFKDVILELIYTKYTISGNFAFWLGSVFVFFTFYHCFHLLFKTFLAPTSIHPLNVIGSS